MDLAEHTAASRLEDGVSGPLSRARDIGPGVALTAIIATISTAAGRAVPAVGAPLIAIVAGGVLAAVRPLPPRAVPGVAFCSRRILQAAVVILGGSLSLREVLHTGLASLPVLIGTLALALAVAGPVGRGLGLSRDVTTLIGVGTAICGASAIAAADSVIDADDNDVAYAVTTIFLFNIVALLVYPTLGRALGLSQQAFGVWAGTAVNDLSSVVATSTLYGHSAQATAVVVKLTRTLAIIPVCVGLAYARKRTSTARGGRPGAGPVPARRVLPWFLFGFVALAALNSIGVIPVGWHSAISQMSTWMITAALAAIGLGTRIGGMRRAGWRPLALGAVLWATVGVSGLALQGLTAVA